jgi:hypothetical protein
MRIGNDSTVRMHSVYYTVLRLLLSWEPCTARFTHLNYCQGLCVPQTCSVQAPACD